jgi:phosphate starvation-inducible PhoH-like protein
MSRNIFDPDDVLAHQQVKTRKKRTTRADKVAHGEVRTIREKFIEERVLPPLRPMNDLQAKYIKLIQEKRLVVATGFAGTSKTYIPTVMACDAYRKGEISKIYLSRPAMSESKSLGYFAGDLVEKMSHWLLPVLTTMYERLGKEVVEIAIKAGDIRFLPLETIKGMSFGKGTFTIVEEAEDLTVKEIKSVLTRQGGGTLILAGDIEQSALNEKSGLRFIKDMSEKYSELNDVSGFVDFNRPSDIVRSDECKAWVLAMRKEKV